MDEWNCGMVFSVVCEYVSHLKQHLMWKVNMYIHYLSVKIWDLCSFVLFLHILVLHGLRSRLYRLTSRLGPILSSSIERTTLLAACDISLSNYFFRQGKSNEVKMFLWTNFWIAMMKKTALFNINFLLM